ncbi:alkylation response protein AidB-like acyl-CoA dehydrogenase [Nocardia kruczakiae]|uniref:Alkylation response protein AidB-like acyl-CoA dehydrogenase n=1 Tax=Nocardia kruczakiae TaxID=261477 RepID=A0ABU1X9V9_9NOCA|nr:acyl-CoA dehydrogenase family protein [Nocardia kruczakiae]MDR7167323.1 alkylation response protein AidB-like acyl-CoA dehydrogenase [Nocardia kruczakiae]
MDLALPPELAEFRQQVRTWLSENVPRTPRPPVSDEARDFDVAWQRTQFDGGWAGINWPQEYGGRGLSLLEQMIWYEEMAWADAPYIGVCFVGINHAGPTLIARANEELKTFHLPKILKGETVWCQGFSEPGAGSDLAGLSLRGEIDGDHLVVNGQKTWTSYAQFADFQELLIRTSRGNKRHHGITWAVCDMHTPGITVRPIELVTGEPELCEVYYDNVRIPLSNVVGKVDDGWSVAMSTLSFERGTGFMKDQVETAREIDQLIEEARTRVDRRGRSRISDDAIAERLATARAEATALSAMGLANITRNARSAQPGPEGSMLRLFYGELDQRVKKLAIDILGTDAAERFNGPKDPSRVWHRSFAQTIAAGSKDIQRNIIGERVLGLPKG